METYIDFTNTKKIYWIVLLVVTIWFSTVPIIAQMRNDTSSEHEDIDLEVIYEIYPSKIQYGDYFYIRQSLSNKGNNPIPSEIWDRQRRYSIHIAEVGMTPELWIPRPSFLAYRERAEPKFLMPGETICYFKAIPVPQIGGVTYYRDIPLWKRIKNNNMPVLLQIEFNHVDGEKQSKKVVVAPRRKAEIDLIRKMGNQIYYNSLKHTDVTDEDLNQLLQELSPETLKNRLFLLSYIKKQEKEPDFENKLKIKNEIDTWMDSLHVIEREHYKNLIRKYDMVPVQKSREERRPGLKLTE